jgi:hypothetical protein
MRRASAAGRFSVGAAPHSALPASEMVKLATKKKLNVAV